MPIANWGVADRSITGVLAKYGLAEAEIHTAWLLRRIIEQERIPDFDKLSWDQRRSAVDRLRAAELIRLRNLNAKAHRQTKKNHQHTSAYVHLTDTEHRNLVVDVATLVSTWDHCVLFAEAINKLHLDPTNTAEQFPNRRSSSWSHGSIRFLRWIAPRGRSAFWCTTIIRPSPTSTESMREFHHQGTLWSKIGHIAETPLFVDSKLTRMVQIADLCSYALRRYVENDEQDLLKLIFSRAHKYEGRAVGVRHFTDMHCQCLICKAHRKGARSAREKACRG